MGPESNLCDRKDKIFGSVYMRTNRTTGRKYQVFLSTGKHTNAILSCLGWFKDHLPLFVANRRMILHEAEKIAFFNAIRQVAQSGGNQIEMLRLSDTAVTKLSSNNPNYKEDHIVRNFSDLILVAMNKNQQYVKAVAANSRKRQAPAALSNTIDKRPRTDDH
jgi:hypothetical protein